MLELKEKNYFEELITKKMKEAVERDIAIESLKGDIEMNPADLLDQATRLSKNPFFERCIFPRYGSLKKII